MGELELKSSNNIGNTVVNNRILIPTNSQSTKDMLLTDFGNYSMSLFSDNFSISNSNNESNISISCTESHIEAKQSRVRPAAVWDCSMCRLSNDTLKKLFFSTDVENIFTSATFDELIKLSQKQTAPTNQQNNAKTVIDLIINNNCTCIESENTSFSVDQELINYCLEHNCTLYSTDYVMCLIAKMFGVKYNYFKQIHLALHYTCKSETSYILLTESILKSSIKPEQVLKFVETNLGSGKFVITDKFIYQLEANKTPAFNNIRTWIDFFLADYNDDYSTIINLSETNLSIIDIAQALDATIICSDIKDCFLYKATNCKFKYIDTTSLTSTSAKSNSTNSTNAVNCANALTSNKSQNVTSVKSSSAIEPTRQTQSTTSVTSTQTNTAKVSEEASTENKLVSVPHLNFTKAVLSLRKLSATERMWVLDEQLHDCQNSYKNSVILKKNMYVIHIIRKFDTYSLTVYKIVSPNCPLSAFIEYSKDFSKEEVNNIDRVYRAYALKATLTI